MQAKQQVQMCLAAVITAVAGSAFSAAAMSSSLPRTLYVKAPSAETPILLLARRFLWSWVPSEHS